LHGCEVTPRRTGSFHAIQLASICLRLSLYYASFSKPHASEYNLQGKSCGLWCSRKHAVWPTAITGKASEKHSPDDSAGGVTAVPFECILSSMWTHGLIHRLLQCILLCSLLTVAGSAQVSQGSPSWIPPSSYTLRIPVNEISLTFRVFDSNGAPLMNLSPDNLVLSDDGRRQNHIVMLEQYKDLPIRAGFLFDTSASIMGYLENNRSIIRLYASRLLRKGTDKAFVMQFDSEPLLRQNWTGDDVKVVAGTAAVRMRQDHLPITSIFDSLYTACRDFWSVDQREVTGNFILLFSDGEDDDSHVYLSEAVDMCQRSRTAIYAISNTSKSPFSTGQRTLEALTRQTGGRVFFNPQGERVWDDLRIIEEEQRNQYRLVYKPSNFIADGRFHSIKLVCSIKGTRIVTRSGYYAFLRP
jgi:Ca-activated chloride channel family protein